MRKWQKWLVLIFCLLAQGFALAATPPNIEGRTYGEKTLPSGEKVQITAQIPTYIEVEGGKVIRFKIYPIAGISNGDEIRIFVAKGKRFEIRIPAWSREEVYLSKDSSEAECANGSTQAGRAGLCWSDGRLQLELESVSGTTSWKLARQDTIPSRPASVSSGVFSLDELMGRARFFNYAVSQEAERVFQAKENIKVARGNLLPSLNIKTVLGLVTGDFIGAIGKLLPFLFPSNWFKWKAQKELFVAERKSFASLRGNEMNSVEELYYSIYRDQAVRGLLEQQLISMRQSQAALAIEEQAGTMPTGSAEYAGVAIAMVEQDRISLQRLLAMEFAELSQAVAIPPLSGVTGLQPVSIPDFTKLIPIQASDFNAQIREGSFEIATLDALIRAAKDLSKDVIFGFLDPEGPGLGFGTASSIQVSKSRIKEIQKRREETLSWMDLSASQVASEYNSALLSVANSRQGGELVRKRLEWLMRRHLNGDATLDAQEFLDQLTDLQLRATMFAADQWNGVHAYLLAKAKLDRLLLRGFYQDLEGSIPEDPETLKEYESRRARAAGAPILN